MTKSAHLHSLIKSLLIACAFYSLKAIQRGMNKNSCHPGWMYRLISIFADHTGLVVGTAVRLLKLFFSLQKRSLLYRENNCSSGSKLFHITKTCPFNTMALFKRLQKRKFQMKKCDLFVIFARNRE